MRRDATVAPQPVAAGAPEMSKAESVVIDVDAGAAAHGVACRICPLSPEGGDGPAMVPGAEVIRLGCGCKEELGDAHRQCAEAWFRIKGDRYTSLALSSFAVLLACFQRSSTSCCRNACYLLAVIPHRTQ
jgi:hypothetical protein